MGAGTRASGAAALRGGCRDRARARPGSPASSWRVGTGSAARLARGGMSTVYRGLDLRLDRPVAIKVMSQEYAADPTFLTRFEREARSAARLDDPAVVAVYDQGRDGDVVFLVMELVDGGTLRDLLRERGPLSVPVTLSVLEPVLRALSAAHAAGLVHRDVKPENVLISTRGEVKVADFGLVRAVTSTTMATGNVILGTVAYLSPEQVATGAADARSDVYSAGIVAYEMLTGHPPFSGDNAIAVAYQHVHADVPPVEFEAPGVPVGIAAAIDAATRRDPLARPRDAAEFLARLQGTARQVGSAIGDPAPVPRPPRAAAARGICPWTAGRRSVADRASGHRRTGDPSPAPSASGVCRTVPVAAASDQGGAGRRRAAQPPDCPTRPRLPASADRSARRAARHHPCGPAGRPHRGQVAARRGIPRAPTVEAAGCGADVPMAAAHHTCWSCCCWWRPRPSAGWWLGGRWTSTPDVRGVAQDAAVALVRERGPGAAALQCPEQRGSQRQGVERRSRPQVPGNFGAAPSPWWCPPAGRGCPSSRPAPRWTPPPRRSPPWDCG